MPEETIVKRASDYQRLDDLGNKIVQIQIDGLRKDIEDHEKRVRLLEESATKFNFINSDGTGTNLTANFSITADAFSSGAKLTVQNNQPTIGWLWFCTVRGNAIVPGDQAKYKVDNLASQAALKAIRSFTLATDWMQNFNAARAAARFLGSFLPGSRKYLSFDLVPDGELQFQLDLGKLITVFLPDDGTEATYRVHYLRHEFIDAAGMLTRTSVMAEPYLAPDLDYWIVPKQIPMKVAY